jgi:hypothetical protein
MKPPRETRTGLASFILLSLAFGIWLLTLFGYRPSIPRVHGYVLGAVLLAAAVVLQLIALGQQRRERALARTGTRVPGVVESLSRVTISADDDAEPLYTLHYRYETAASAAHRGSVLLPKSQAWQWREGDRGWVRYDAQHEDRSYWEPGAPPAHAQRDEKAPAPPSLVTLARRSAALRQGFPAIFILALVALIIVPPTLRATDASMKLVMAALGAFLLCWLAARLLAGAREVLTAQRIVQSGVATEAVVAAVREIPRRNLQQSLIVLVDWSIDFEYRDADRRRQTARGGATQREALGLRPGDRVLIKVDPHTPGVAVLLGKAEQ